MKHRPQNNKMQRTSGASPLILVLGGRGAPPTSISAVHERISGSHPV